MMQALFQFSTLFQIHSSFASTAGSASRSIKPAMEIIRLIIITTITKNDLIQICLRFLVKVFVRWTCAQPDAAYCQVRQHFKVSCLGWRDKYLCLRIANICIQSWAFMRPSGLWNRFAKFFVTFFWLKLKESKYCLKIKRIYLNCFIVNLIYFM